MPVFNAEAFLPAALESILGQGFGDFELIAVDDGSTDGSLAVLREFASRDRRIKIISRPNTGIAGARNDAIAAADGRYIACADADDVSLPGRFQAQMQFLAEHPELAVLGGSLQEIDRAGNLLPTIYRYPTDPKVIARDLLKGCCFGQPSVMINRRMLLEAGGYRRAFPPAEDYDLWLRLAERHPLANLPDILVHYRVHPLSATSSAYLEQAVATEVARRAAIYRRGHGNGIDPVGEAFTDELLQALGISPLDVQALQAGAYRARISAMIERGQLEAARALVARYDQSVFAPSIRRRYAGEFEFLQARAEWHAGHRQRAAAKTLFSCLTHPAFAMRLLAKAARRIRYLAGR